MTLAETRTGTTTAEPTDVIAHLAAIAPDSALARLRAERPDIVRYAQGSYLALLAPDDLGGVSRVEREQIALRVAALTQTAALLEWHRERLLALGVGEDLIAAIVDQNDHPALTPRLVALLRHTDRVTNAPASSTKVDLAELSAVGLSPRDIVTVAQLIAFLSFQVRALVGLRLLVEES